MQRCTAAEPMPSLSVSGMPERGRPETHWKWHQGPCRMGKGWVQKGRGGALAGGAVRGAGPAALAPCGVPSCGAGAGPEQQRRQRQRGAAGGHHDEGLPPRHNQRAWWGARRAAPRVRLPHHSHRAGGPSRRPHRASLTRSQRVLPLVVQWMAQSLCTAHQPSPLPMCGHDWQLEQHHPQNLVRLILTELTLSRSVHC